MAAGESDIFCCAQVHCPAERGSLNSTAWAAGGWQGKHDLLCTVLVRSAPWALQTG